MLFGVRVEGFAVGGSGLGVFGVFWPRSFSKPSFKT